MPFDEEEDNVEPQKTGLKINNSKSFLKDLPVKQSKEKFEKHASEVNEQLNEYGTRAAELALRFKKVLEDRILLQNKTMFSTDSERDLLSEIVKLGIDMNTDEHEQDGMGSMGLIMLLFRTVIIQRDRLNNLDFNVSSLEKKIKALEAIALDAKSK